MSIARNVWHTRNRVLIACISSLCIAAAYGDETEESGDALAEVVVTGTRITVPGVTSSSPVYSVGAAEIDVLQQPEVEKIFRLLPITLPADGQNVNNGTGGAATISLRGLEPQRNLILIDGKRVTPFSSNGAVDTSTIPTALIERVDIVTGGASAVYGSDAISGAVNFLMKRDFEGVAIDTDFSRTGDNDGDIKTVSLTLGSNVADGRGNIVLGVNWSDREGVQLGARPLGRLGIQTADGQGLSNFLGGLTPAAPPAGCGGPDAVAVGGSTTTVPTRVSIAGGPALGQFREDGTLGADCSVFNFNPYNYYQTPMRRFGGTAIGHVELNERAEVYGRLGYSSTRVSQQVAPSGVFGNPFWTPLSNPFISTQARSAMISAAEAGRTAVDATTGAPAPTVVVDGAAPNWRDLNSNGIVDAADDLNISYRRRTVEFGGRSTEYDYNAWYFVVGLRGQLSDAWSYDLSYQRGETTGTNALAGYTNVSNIANAINSVSTTTCRSGGACVPLNLFGGFGSITPQMAAYSSASALLQLSYTQSIATASVSGAVDQIRLPWADSALGLSVGVEYREEEGASNPDECLKLAPTSCLGGAGGNTLPVIGGFDVSEAFAEAILPVVRDRRGFQSVDLELGFRYSDYNPTGADRTWKYGLSWRPVDTLLFRAMRQRAARAPNVGELAAPVVTSLDNAVRDPCSRNTANVFTPELRALCVATGMSNAQVGTVEDIVSGQVNSFSGTNPSLLPKPEAADTTTFGFVWTPAGFGERLRNPIITVDYYDIDISGVIDSFGAQEVLDSCYKAGVTSECAKVVRVGGTLTLPGSGIQTFTTNLLYLRAEGVELGANVGVDIGRFGSLTFSANVNRYLTKESRSAAALPVVDCNGFYGTQCGNPLPKVRWIQRTTWARDAFDVSLLWRHFGEASIEPAQVASGVFPQFQKIGSYDYFDLTGSWAVNDAITVRASVSNLFDESPPVVGNEAGTTSSNSGNTFPSVYDTLGRVLSLGVNLKF